MSGTRYGLIGEYRFDGSADRSCREALRTEMSLAITQIEDIGMEGDERRNGIAAIDAWISSFEAGSASRFFTSYNLLWIISARQYLIPFFTQSAITPCMAIQDTVLRHLMLDAAGVYMTGYRTWVALRELFPFPHSADTTDPRLKAEAVKLLREAREAETAGLALLRDIVGHLSN